MKRTPQSWPFLIFGLVFVIAAILLAVLVPRADAAHHRRDSTQVTWSRPCDGNLYSKLYVTNASGAEHDYRYTLTELKTDPAGNPIETTYVKNATIAVAATGQWIRQVTTEAEWVSIEVQLIPRNGDDLRRLEYDQGPTWTCA